jgi:hypothetical protein
MSQHVLYFAAFILVDLVYYATNRSSVQYLITGDCVEFFLVFLKATCGVNVVVDVVCTQCD